VEQKSIRRREFLSGAAAAPLLMATPQDTEEAGFTLLFDGQSLDGWSVEEGRESAFYVNDGAIVAHESEGYPAWLRSARQYENFDFRGDAHA
jgi:hypothetical protein